MDYNNYLPKKRLPYAVRIRNRIIVFSVFMGICALMGTCIFGEKEVAEPADEEEIVEEAAAQEPNQTSNEEIVAPGQLFPKADSEDLVNTQATVAAAVVPETPSEVDVIDSTHIKAQKDVFLAEKIDNLLRRFRPEHAVILMVDPKSNEIIAWGERRNNHVQEKPDYFIKNTFPAASLAKTVTISAAMESNRYSLTSQIPMIGSSTKLYQSQLRVKEGYKGPFIEL